MKAATSEPAAEGRAHPSGGVPTSSAAARLLCSAGPANDAPAVFTPNQCQSLLEQRLTRPLLDLFHELTGLHLHVWWHARSAELSPGDFPKPCPTARQRPARKLPATCEACLRKRWQPACDNQKTEQRFAGLCGSINYCACLKVLDLRLLTLLLQQTPPASRADKKAFLRAVGLARLIVHDLEATLAAGRAAHGPGRAGERLNRVNHRQHLVEAMLDYIHEHYSHPMQLADLAAALNLNAAYVFDLFSTMLGVTFHHYLEELRLARAKELLRDPRKQVCEVARAVGYTNPNHFRSVFTTRVGTPPSAWR
jgi:AraC-like DNA-binding protein